MAARQELQIFSIAITKKNKNKNRNIDSKPKKRRQTRGEDIQKYGKITYCD